MNWQTSPLGFLHSGLSHIFYQMGRVEINPFCAPSVANMLAAESAVQIIIGSWALKLLICLAPLASCIYPVKVSLGNPKAFVGQTVFTLWLSALELLCCILLLCNHGQIQFIT